MLEDSLREIDPKSPFIVEAAGPRLSPKVHKHNPFHKRHLGEPCTRRLLEVGESPPKTRRESQSVTSNATALARLPDVLFSVGLCLFLALG